VATVGEASDTAAVAEAYFSAVGNRDLEAMAALWEPGGVGEIHGLVELVAPVSYGEWFGNLFRAVPDFRLEIVEIVAQGEKAAVRWRATGTFDGSARFEGLAPNGARIDVTGCDVIAVRDGRLYRNDAYMNGAEMMRQLGALPPAGSAAENLLTAALNAKTRIFGWIAERRRGPQPHRQ
jgi:predicted ester cyclase